MLRRFLITFFAAMVLGLVLSFFGLSKLIFPSTVIFLILANVQAMLAGTRPESKAAGGERDAALSQPTDPHLCTVYIYRSGFVAQALGMDLSLDAVPVAQLRSPRFTMLRVQPGPHSLAVSGKGTAPNAAPVTAFFEATPAATLVFQINIKMGGFYNKLSLEPEPEISAALTKMASMTMVVPS